MRIGIDARLWNETGVGRYIRNLITELHKIDNKNQYVVFVTPQVFRDNALAFTQNSGKKWNIVPSDIPWHTVEEQLLFYKVLENEYLDLVHFPYFSIPILYTRPFVITIHDLIINHFPTGKASTLPTPVYYLKRLGYQFILKQATKKAKKVIAVSNATKQEIIDHLPVSDDKIVVTYEGVDSGLVGVAKASRKKLSEEQNPYFLFVGNAYPHKNVDRLIDAFQTVLHDAPHVQLVLVGKSNYFYARLEEKVKKLGLQKNVIFTGAANDSMLQDLYGHAEALVFPSLMEGFGLPGLEAMQAGCLVLASDIPVFNEVYGKAAVYFDPLDSRALSDTMLKVIREKKSFAMYKEKGLVQVQKYSWQTMAKETIKVYESSISIR